MSLTNTLPSHSCGLYLEHNAYKCLYESVEHAVADLEDAWISPEERVKALETGDIWTLQWYPDTPVGFYLLAASNLDVLLDRARCV